MRVVGIVLFWATSLVVYLALFGVMRGLFPWGFRNALMQVAFLGAAAIAAFGGHRALFGPRDERGKATARAVAGLIAFVAVIGLSVFFHTAEAARHREALRRQSEAAAERQAQMAQEAAERRAAEVAAAAQRIPDERLPGMPARIASRQAESDPILWIPATGVGFQNGGVIASASRLEMLREVTDRGGARHVVVRLPDGRIGWLPADRVEVTQPASDRSTR